MRAREKSRGERGSALILSMLTLIALLTIGSLTALSVQSDAASAGAEQQKQIATYAAESGVAAGMEFLRQNLDSTQNWTAFVSPNNATPMEPALVPGQGQQPAGSGNLFAPEMRMWYRVQLFNNVSDPGLAAGEDQDGRIVVRSTGFGPNGASAIVEVEIRAMGGTPAGRPCPVYGQRGIADDGAGRNDCLGQINAGDMQAFRPGDAP